MTKLESSSARSGVTREHMSLTQGERKLNAMSAPHDNHALTGPRAIDNLGRDSGPSEDVWCAPGAYSVVEPSRVLVGFNRYRTIFVRQIDALH